MKANELRLGNWLRFDNHIQPTQYIQINARWFSSLAGGRSIEEMKPDESINNYYSGIPLTSEILERCGLEERKYRTWNLSYHIGTFSIRYIKRKQEYSFNTYKNCGREIKYLHELQNLYFALTGEELTITNLT